MTSATWHRAPHHAAHRARSVGLATGVGVNALVACLYAGAVWQAGTAAAATAGDTALTAFALFFAAGSVASSVTVIAGAALALARRTREYGIGLLVGAALGIVLLAAVGIAAAAIATHS
jgi:hypothetical protein